MLNLIFKKGGIVNSASEAVTKCLKENIEKTFGSMNSHQWRLDKFWNEGCDLVLRQYMPIIKEIYKKYSGRFALPGKPK